MEKPHLTLAKTTDTLILSEEKKASTQTQTLHISLKTTILTQRFFAFSWTLQQHTLFTDMIILAQHSSESITQIILSSYLLIHKYPLS